MRYTDLIEVRREDLEITALVIAGKIENERRRALHYGLALVLITPLAFLIAIALLIAGAFLCLHDSPTPAAILPFLLPIFSVLAAFVFLLGQISVAKQKGFNTAAFARIAIAVVVSFLLASSSMSISHPSLFWTLQIALTLLIMALVGTTLELGWYEESPQSEEIDRAVLGTFIASAVPGALLMMYAELIRKAWLWRGLDQDERFAASAILYAVANEDFAMEKKIFQCLGKERARRVLDSLLHLELVRFSATRLRLNEKGEIAMGIRPAPVDYEH
ncbi:MAG TPA: hypothetical protein VEK08_09380 [Planctomycetota bacterium]|nr:hypothetical protein [Planctomycetota bacterium]